MECNVTDLTWDDTIEMDDYTEEHVCAVLVSTNGDCNEWCSN